MSYRNSSYISLKAHRAGILTALIALACLLFSVNSGLAVMEVRENIAEVCYQCHESTRAKPNDKFQHAPFKQGKCASCHSSHVSKKKGLMKDAVTELCIGCHQNIGKLFGSASVHGALLSGSCTDCHEPHAGSRSKLLKKDETEICWSCHAEAKKGLDKARLHQPFKDGSCSVCHNPHASSEDALLVSGPNKLCRNCHQPRCKAGGVAVSDITKDKKCTSCHSGHAAAAKGLLGPNAHQSFLDRQCEACHLPIAAGKPIKTKQAGPDLCRNCHTTVPIREGDVHLYGQDGESCANCHESHSSRNPKILIRPGKFCATCHDTVYRGIRSMEKAYSLRCVPVRDRQCFACHLPPHAEAPLYLKIPDPIGLCASCHKAAHKSAHPLGEKAIDPRDGKPMTCLTCHRMHSAKAGFMLTHDGKRQLCIQCHKRM